MPLKANARYPLVLIALLLGGCGPLVPLSYNRENPQSDLTQTIESPEATIVLEFLDLQNGYRVFDLEIVNCSSSSIHVAPQNISFYSSSNLFAPVNDVNDVYASSIGNSGLIVKRQFACNAEQVIKVYNEKVKAKQAGLVFFAILGAGLIVYDAVKDAEDSKKEAWTTKDEIRAETRDLLVNASLTAASIAKEQSYQSAEENFYIPYEILPECEIGPGNRMRGKVFIPMMEDPFNYARLVLPIQDTNYVFDFKKRGVRVRK
jgi:hypothetical protein